MSLLGKVAKGLGSVAKGVFDVSVEVAKYNVGYEDANNGRPPEASLYGQDESYTRAYNQKLAERHNDALNRNGY